MIRFRKKNKFSSKIVYVCCALYQNEWVCHDHFHLDLLQRLQRRNCLLFYSFKLRDFFFKWMAFWRLISYFWCRKNISILINIFMQTFCSCAFTTELGRISIKIFMATSVQNALYTDAHTLLNDVFQFDKVEWSAVGRSYVKRWGGARVRCIGLGRRCTQFIWQYNMYLAVDFV